MYTVEADWGNCLSYPTLSIDVAWFISSKIKDVHELARIQQTSNPAIFITYSPLMTELQIFQNNQLEMKT